MAVQPIYVDVEEEIPELIERLKLSSADEIPVVVPVRSRLAQSRFNFQLLRDYARRLDKRIAIISPDPAVQQMATENGFPTFSAVEEYSDRDLIGTAVAASLGGSAVAAAPALHREAPAARSFPRREKDPRPPRLLVRPQATTTERRGGSGRFVVGLLAVAALLFGIVGAAIFVPSARVTLIAQAKDFSHSADVQAAPNSAPVKVRLVTQNKQLSRTFQSSGTKTTPAEYARGGVVYSYTCPGAVVLFNGSRLSTADGKVFAQLGDVQISKGIPRAANVIAVNFGGAGNVPAGAITIINNAGALSACLSVNNPAPTAGGTDEQKLIFISQGDLDAAKSQLDSDLKAQVQDEMAKQAQTSEKLADSIDWKLEFFPDHKAGDGVTNFSATATETGNGALYNGDDVKKALVAELQKSVPKDQALTDNQIATDFHVVSASADGHMAFHGTSKGFIAPKIDFTKVRARLAGQNTIAARSYLQTLPIQSVDLSQQPFQLPVLPFLGSRIDIRYEVQAGTAATKP